MHSQLLFWLNSYHVIARNTTKLVPIIQMGKIAPTRVDEASSVKRQTLHYPEHYLKRISTPRGTLLIFNSNAEIFWRIAVFKKFTDLKKSEYLRSLENYLQKSLLLVKLLVLLTKE